MKRDTPESWADFSLSVGEFHLHPFTLKKVVDELLKLGAEQTLPETFVELGAGTGVVIARQYLRARLQLDLPTRLQLVDFSYGENVARSDEVRVFALQRLLETVMSVYLEKLEEKDLDEDQANNLKNTFKSVKEVFESKDEERMKAELQKNDISVSFEATNINVQELNMPQEEFALGGHRVINYFDRDRLQKILDNRKLKTLILVDTNGAGSSESQHEKAIGIDSLNRRLKTNFFKRLLGKSVFITRLNENSVPEKRTGTRALVLTRE